MDQEQYQAQRLRKRMWITIVVAFLALVTVILSVMSGAFNFHKGGNELPNLTGMSETDAVELIQKLKGNPSVSYEASNLPEGTVIRQGLPAGDTVMPNTSVSIVVSSGKAPTTSAPDLTQELLPSFIGLSKELAESTAEQLGVSIIEDGYVYDDNIPYGSVVEQSPEGGTKIVRGSAVKVKLSAGPEIVRYTITIEAGHGGTVYPDTITVEEGEDVTVTITPDDGYVVDKLIVDGEEVQPLQSYSFLTVDSNHTLSVSFREQAKNPIEDFFDQIFG